MNNAEVLVKFKGDTKDLDEKTSKVSGAIKGLGSGLKGALAAGAIAAASAVVALTKATIDLTKASVEAYAEYEQLIGGVETLFKESADKVEAYANQAYKTAGLSANEYMSTVTSFSASLLQGLAGDTDKAADYADQAIQDMSDNANKMGTDMSMIQSAYQGFAKQNFTMLDNLKLGYGGTRGEMQRLLDDAEKLSGIHYDIGNFADITQAIHIIQNNLGITGTTAKEAASTITGSLNMTKSAWENLVAGFSKKDVNLDELVDQVIDSALTFANNVLPVVERALNGIAKALPRVVERLAEELPTLIENLLPPIIDACITLVRSITKNLPALLKILIDAVLQALDGILDLLPEIIGALLDGAIAIIEALAEALPELLPKIIDVVIKGIIKITEYTPQIIQAAIKLLMGIVDAIPQIITALVDNLPDIITTIITTLIEAIPELIQGAFKLLFGLIKAIPLIIVELVRAIPEIIIALVDALTSSESLHQLLEAAKTLLREMTTGIKDGISQFFSVGKDLIVGLWNGISDKVSWITNKIKGFGNSVLKSIKGIFGIHSPSTEFEWIGKMNVEGLEKGMEEMQPELQKTLNGMFDLQPNVTGNMSNTLSPNLNVVVNNNMEVDPLGQVVNKIKTFSGGAKNDYNWGATR